MDLEVACIIYAQNEQLTNWSEEKEIFDKAYALWWKADFKGEIANYLGE